MRVGCIGYATEQGVGYLAKSFYDAGVITDMVIFLHENRNNHFEWYPPGTLQILDRPFAKHGGKRLDELVRVLDVMLFFETPFDWTVLPYCKDRDVKTVIMPMYEWYPDCPPHRPDMLICPSRLDADYFPGSPFIPVPVPQGTWQLRTRAHRFLHNAGGIGFREHKGTLELLKAVDYVQSPFHLTVRSQDGEGLRALLRQVPGVEKDPRIEIQIGGIPYDRLWDGHDVLIAPEKFNGLSLPLQEGRAAGMLVMTTDRYPMNTWLPREPLIPVQETRRIRIAEHLQEIEECIVDPRDIARTIDAWYDRDTALYSMTGRQWALENSWEMLKPRYLEALAC